MSSRLDTSLFGVRSGYWIFFYSHCGNSQQASLQLLQSTLFI